jgi:hypothetical protein
MKHWEFRIVWSGLLCVFGFCAGYCVVAAISIRLHGHIEPGIGPFSILLPLTGALLGLFLPWLLWFLGWPKPPAPPTND